MILALPHLGGWEWAGRWLCDLGYKTTVVVERIEPPELFDWFIELRESLGMTVLPLGPDVAPGVLKALRANEIVCLLCDRDLGGGGVEVEFFGERTTLPGGPATLGLRAGAPILPVGVYFTRQVNGHHSVIRPPLSMERTRPAARRRRPHHPGPRPRARVPDPPGARPVAHVPAQLAVGPRISALTH